MPDFRQWQVWQVWWVYEDAKTKAIVRESRPAVLLSNARQCSVDSELAFAQISSTKRDIPGVVVIDFADPEFRQTGLDHTSYLYMGAAKPIPKKLGTEVTKDGYIRCLGILGQATAARARAAAEEVLRNLRAQR